MYTWGILYTKLFHAIVPNTIPPFCSTISTSCSRHVVECHFAICHRSRAAENIHTTTEFVMVVQLYKQELKNPCLQQDCNAASLRDTSPFYVDCSLWKHNNYYTGPIVITSHELQTSLTKSYSIDLFTTTHQQNWFWNCMTGERTVWGDWCKTMHKVVWPFVNYN